ncbi:TetR/AcrR family transcriptional regulator [Solimonas sp. K1W22B-7]|uniref:TetR/AcrR family transcriptional regulator n=1 Tax=Solimonas sp. K1W22B-7 TaxID=2303331 RepID=UPI0013C4A6AD|nr:TetR/AcrR family transcriptional regulator [Solimonas sp. K1W22B-7]
MNDLQAGLSAPRAPLQQRGQARFELVLEEARKLLIEQGMAGFSIPVLAERLGFTRASIYNFFPTPYAVLNELARRELQDMEQRLVALPAAHPPMSWTEQVRLTVDTAARFHNERPVARLLILGGAQTDESYRAQAMTIDHLGSLSQRLFADAGILLPREPVDVMVLAVDLGTTCFRHSVLLHGHITDAYREEATRAMLRYLTPYVRQLLLARRRG